MPSRPNSVSQQLAIPSCPAKTSNSSESPAVPARPSHEERFDFEETDVTAEPSAIAAPAVPGRPTSHNSKGSSKGSSSQGSDEVPAVPSRLVRVLPETIESCPAVPQRPEPRHAQSQTTEDISDNGPENGDISDSGKVRKDSVDNSEVACASYQPKEAWQLANPDSEVPRIPFHPTVGDNLSPAAEPVPDEWDPNAREIIEKTDSTGEPPEEIDFEDKPQEPKQPDSDPYFPERPQRSKRIVKHNLPARTTARPVPDTSDVSVNEIIDIVDSTGSAPEEIDFEEKPRVKPVERTPYIPQRPEPSKRLVKHELAPKGADPVPDTSDEEIIKIIDKVDSGESAGEIGNLKERKIDGVQNFDHIPHIPQRPRVSAKIAGSEKHSHLPSDVKSDQLTEPRKEITVHHATTVDEPVVQQNPEPTSRLPQDDIVKETTDNVAALKGSANLISINVHAESAEGVSPEGESSEEQKEEKQVSPNIPPSSSKPAFQISSDDSSGASTSPPVPQRPSIPARPGRPTSSENSSSSDKPKPMVPARPARSAKIQAFLDNQNQEEQPKPKVKPPIASKVGALRASLFKDLGNMIARGPPPPGTHPHMVKVPSAERDDDQTEDADAMQQSPKMSRPPADFRRGRVKGPTRRLPATVKIEWSTMSAHLWEYVGEKESTKERVEEGGQENVQEDLLKDALEDDHEPVEAKEDTDNIPESPLESPLAANDPSEVEEIPSKEAAVAELSRIATKSSEPVGSEGSVDQIGDALTPETHVEAVASDIPEVKTLDGTADEQPVDLADNSADAPSEKQPDVVIADSIWPSSPGLPRQSTATNEHLGWLYTSIIIINKIYPILRVDYICISQCSNIRFHLIDDIKRRWWSPPAALNSVKQLVLWSTRDLLVVD